jgi:hypothetical protein
MANVTKAQLMEALLASKAKTGNGAQRTSSNTGDNASYPFWNMETGSSATVRFLPDGDENNTFFWVKREVLKIPFAGIEGGDYPTSNNVEVTVPCAEMWGEVCPVIQAIRPWWNDPAKKEDARTYYKKKSYIFQGFVKNSPFVEENLPENPIRRFVINPSIFNIIEKSLMDPEMEEMPTDFVGGVDFRIRKDKQGEYANYTGSEWSRKTRSLDAEELTAIETHGLFDLKQYQGERLDDERKAAIKAMFDDSVLGRPFDHASFGHLYRAYGNGPRGAGAGAAAGAATTTAATTVRGQSYESAATTVAVQAQTPVETPAAVTGASVSPSDIMARLKARTGQ